ncbi:MAG TPA: FkbM family methyltransferase [Nitrososphaeraceae archaeon]|nr:FkbM family methyltransferase [Nitrososphaeraceae archaeon]
MLTICAHMQDRIVSWLLKQPEASLSPALDMCILVPMRIAYLILRYLLRLILRNEERIRRLRILPKVYDWLSGFFSPSIHTAKITDRIIRKIAGPSRQSFMVKVTVPKYRYRYYCKIIDFAPGREDDIIEYFNPAVGNIVIDVGAHVGRYTILASKLVGRSGKVIAVEAHPGNFQLLKRNLQLNNSENNVITFNCAAYCKDTPQLRLFLAGEERGNTIYNTVMESRYATEKFVSVPALKLDSIVQHLGIQAHEINWIKIDVEGAEYEVLQGAQNILSNSRDISVLIEIHNLQENTNLYNPIIDMLRKCKFSIIFEKVYDNGERHIIGRKSLAERRYHSYKTASDHLCD